MYTQYTTNHIEAVGGKPVIVGPVKYTITFEGTHKGSKKVPSEYIFVKIGIIAKNISNEKTIISEGQFYIVDDKEQKHKHYLENFHQKICF